MALIICLCAIGISIPLFTIYMTLSSIAESLDDLVEILEERDMPAFGSGDDTKEEEFDA